MKILYKILIVNIIILTHISWAKGQQTQANYGNIPDELVAYDKYQKAYKYHFLTPTWFYGAGREIPPPKDLDEVRLGFLGPLEGSIIQPLGVQMMQGALLAVEEANKKGGYKGTPYRLMVHNDFGLWGAAANEVVKMDDEGVWAWVGTIDDINSHVAIRATLKLEIPVINPGDPDPTYTETNIPWVLRNIPDDRQSSYALVKEIYVNRGYKRVAMMRANNRYGRVGTMHFNRSATRIGYPPIIEERFNDLETDFRPQLERIKKISPDAILIWGNAKESGMIVKQIRELGMNQPIYGSDRMVNNEFLETAGKYAEGVVTTCQYNPSANDPKLKAFQAEYKKRFGQDPNVFAAHAYDAINMIIAAIEKVGLNRALIRDVLTDLKTFQGYKGVTGVVIFDGAFNNLRPIYLARVANNKFEFSPAPKFERDTTYYKKINLGY
ncbi:MAG: amino acid ABC transporter substrate-binding protein [Bacteroidales bacterium]|nr:amino acid ABC transporter substrate-binding protein [Bacteroidales bacterium]